MRRDSSRYAKPPLPDIRSARGSVSIIFMVMVLPFVCALLTLTIDLSYYFGIRDELQRVIDREAHDALVLGKTSAEVERSIRTRMRNTRGMASISTVRMTPSQGKNTIFVGGRYSGAFSQVAQRLYGKESAALTFAARSQVRIQSSATLIVLDISEVTAGSECGDRDLQSMGTFVDRLTNSWVQSAGTAVSVSVTPGLTKPLEAVSLLGADDVARCAARSTERSSDMRVVRGVSGANRFSSTAVAHHVQEIVSERLLAQPAQLRSLVLIFRRPSFDRGYTAQIHAAVRDVMRAAATPVDFYALVIDDTASFDSQPFRTGINGGAFRELTVSGSDLLGLSLISAVTQTITDRIVLER